jgi:hypothetical protein
MDCTAPVVVVPPQSTAYAVKDESPVPPPATGSPVQLVKVPDEGVPRAGVTNVGDVEPTKVPVPV